MSFLYNFGMSQEDERTETAALQLTAKDRVLSIASAGDMPLSLIALGAGKVDAVDVDPAQLHLSRLKLAAVRSLPREQAIAFLGLLPASPEERIDCLHRLLPALPEESRRFWLRNKPAVQGGAVWAGRYEQYVGRIVRVALPILGRKGFDALLACRTIDEQREAFDRHFAGRRLRTLFQVAFHPKLFSSRGMDPRSLAHRKNQSPLGEQYFHHFRSLCTATPARDNHLLQLTLMGRVRDVNTVPAYLSEPGVEEIRKRSDDLAFIERDLLTYLQGLEPGAFDKAHLSNLPDWLDQQAFDRVMGLIVDKAAPGARFVWRYIHVNRPIPEGLSPYLQVEVERGQALRKTDRFPFYAIVCGSIRSDEEDRATGTRVRAHRMAQGDRVAPGVDGFEFRPLGREHGDSMIAINRNCPIEADFTVVFERSPDFFRWPDLIYDRYQYVGIRHRDELIGYCMTGEMTGWTGAGEGSFFYGGDARVLREFRGKRAAELGLRHALDLLPENVNVGFGLVKQGNEPAQRTVDTGYSEHFEEARRVPFEAINLLLLRRLSTPTLEVRKARKQDLEDMAALFNGANGRRLFAPHLDGYAFEERMSKPGLQLDRWYLVLRGTRLVGMGAAWDQHEFHRTQVLRYSLAATGLRGIYEASRRVFRDAAPLPNAGEALRSITLSHLAVAQSDPTVLRALIHAIVNDHMGRGYHLLHVGFVADDPLRRATHGMLRQRFPSGIVVGVRRGKERCDGWTRGLPYVDLAMI